MTQQLRINPIRFSMTKSASTALYTENKNLWDSLTDLVPTAVFSILKSIFEHFSFMEKKVYTVLIELNSNLLSLG